MPRSTIAPGRLVSTSSSYPENIGARAIDRSSERGSGRPCRRNPRHVEHFYLDRLILIYESSEVTSLTGFFLLGLATTLGAASLSRTRICLCQSSGFVRALRSFAIRFLLDIRAGYFIAEILERCFIEKKSIENCLMFH